MIKNIQINPYKPVFSIEGPGEPDPLGNANRLHRESKFSLLPFPPLLSGRADPHYSLLKCLEVNLGPSPQLMIL